MSRTAEIVTAVESIRSEITDATDQAGQAREQAVELGEQAAGHGWDGLTVAMQQAQDALKATAASLATANDAAGEGRTGLQAVTDQMSRPDVATHLGQALTSLDKMRVALDAAISTTDDARSAAEQAGSPETLMSMLQGISDSVDSAWRALDTVKGTIESEQTEAAAWGNG